MNLKQNLTSVGAAIGIAAVSGCNDKSQYSFRLPENIHEINKSVPPEVGTKMREFIAAEVEECLFGNFTPEDSNTNKTTTLGKYANQIDFLCDEGSKASIAINPKSICPQVLTTKNGTDYDLDISRCAAGL